MEVEFQNVNVSLAKDGKKLLDNVSGKITSSSCRPMAMIGASGAGKSTLLNRIGHRFDGALRYSGEVLYNSSPWNPSLKSKIAFVPQDDLILGTLTVLEHLSFTARLKLNVSEDYESRVNEVISILDIDHARNIKTNTISGGERKRTCIANELIGKPDLLLLDEPTSGLDSAIAVKLVDILCNLSSGKKGNHKKTSVIATIHQPSTRVFERFQSLLVLNKGSVFYRGDVSSLLWYLETEMNRPSPPNTNPSDFVMDLVVLDGLEANPMFKDTPQLYCEEKKFITIPPMRSIPLDESITHKTKYANNWLHNTRVLVERFWARYRQDILTPINLVLFTGLAVIAGLLWFQLEPRENLIYKYVSLCFWISGTWQFLGMFSSLYALSEDRELLDKELHDGSYHLSSNFLAISVTLMPSTIFWMTYYSIIVLPVSNIVADPLNGLLLYLISMLDVLLFQSFGLFLGSFIPKSSLMTAAILTATFNFAWTGVFAALSSLPQWIQWVQYLNFLVYVYELVVRVVFTDGYSCTDNENSIYESCLANSNGTVTPQEVFDQYEIRFPVEVCLVVILIGIIGLRVVAYMLYHYHLQDVMKLDSLGEQHSNNENEEMNDDDNAKEDKIHLPASNSSEINSLEVV